MKKRILLVLLLTLVGFFAVAQTVSDFVSIPTPDDLEVDRFGNVWVNYQASSAPDTFRLAKIAPTGVVTVVITEYETLGQFGINDSIIWIVGPWGASSFVYKYDHSGNKLDSISMPFATAIILDPDGTWYVTQNALGQLTKVNPDKTTEVLAAGTPLAYNLALARDENGTFFTCNLMDAKVIKIDTATSSKTVLATLPTSSPYSLGFLAYANGRLYVPSAQNCIYSVDTSGSGNSVYVGTPGSAGNLNGDVSLALLNEPISVASSTTGDTLYFSEAGNNKVRMITGVNSATGAQKTEAKGAFRLYPNPTEDSVIIDGVDVASVEVYDAVGKLVFSAEHTKTILIGSLPKGVYLINVLSEYNNVVYSGKIIKE